MSVNVSDALKIARTLLNDDQGTVWYDTILIPKLQLAYRELVSQLTLNDIPLLKERTSYIQIPAVNYSGLYNQVPITLTLPADFVEPIKMKEHTPGSPDVPDDMVEQEWEPDINVDDTLRYWVWRNGNIEMIGSTVPREVILYYISTLTIPSVNTDLLIVPLAETYIGPQIAYYAALSVTDPQYNTEEYKRQANEGLEKVLMIMIKNQQNLPSRRIPYHRARRVRVTSF